MKIYVRAYSSFEYYVCTNWSRGWFQLELSAEQTLKEVVLYLGIPWDEIGLMTIDGKNIRKEESILLYENAHIEIFPIIHGG